MKYMIRFSCHTIGRAHTCQKRAHTHMYHEPLIYHILSYTIVPYCSIIYLYIRIYIYIHIYIYTQPIHLFPSLFLSFSESLTHRLIPAPSKAPEELQRVAPTVEALEVEALQGLVLAGAGRGGDLPQI